jgi:thymidylate synthase
MRIYSNLYDAVRETERELFEMGIEVWPETMQDKVIKGNEDYKTKEIRGYSFKINGWKLNWLEIHKVLEYFFPKQGEQLMRYCSEEFKDRISEIPLNPGNSYQYRLDIWKEFLHDDKFAYTYSERMAEQVNVILEELKKNPSTRQAIINIHSNICPLVDGQAKDTGQKLNHVEVSADIDNRGGGGRVPCSLYYQLMIREGRLDLIYAMRSCDLLAHFAIDIILALLLQSWFADELNIHTGEFTYFCGSLHSYYHDLKVRGIF